MMMSERDTWRDMVKDRVDRSQVSVKRGVCLTVDGQWLPWGSWSNCASGCGHVQVRHRECVPPRYGGRNCSHLPGASNLPMDISESTVRVKHFWLQSAPLCEVSAFGDRMSCFTGDNGRQTQGLTFVTLHENIIPFRVQQTLHLLV